MQFTKLFTHFVVKFIHIHYKKFEMRNINNEQMISKVEPLCGDNMAWNS